MKKNKTSILTTWLPLIGCIVVSYVLSSIDGVKLPELNKFNLDKLAHAIEFFVITFLMMRTIKHTWPGLGSTGAFFISIFLVMAYGVSDELRQIAVPNRTCDFIDLFFDFIGASTGIFVCTYREDEPARPIQRYHLTNQGELT